MATQFMVNLAKMNARLEAESKEYAALGPRLPQVNLDDIREGDWLGTGYFRCSFEYQPGARFQLGTGGFVIKKWGARWRVRCAQRDEDRGDPRFDVKSYTTPDEIVEHWRRYYINDVKGFGWVQLAGPEPQYTGELAAA